MTRLDDDTLAHHFEVALSSASPSTLAELQHADRYRRMAAVSTLSRYLTERMRCFDLRNSRRRSIIRHCSRR